MWRNLYRNRLAASAVFVALGMALLLVNLIPQVEKGLTAEIDLPQADAALRAEIDAEAAAEGWPAMHAKLARLDPTTAARLHPTDSQRLQRALEICRLTGRPMSALLAESEKQKPPYDQSSG